MLQYMFVFAAGLWTGKHLLKGISLQKSELLWHLTFQFKNKLLRSQHKSLTLGLKYWEQGTEVHFPTSTPASSEAQPLFALLPPCWKAGGPARP